MMWVGFTMDERRKHQRVEISFPLECSLLPTNKYFYTVSKDLSVGGIKIIVDRFLARNNTMKVGINLVDKLVNAKARVAWCNQQGNTDRYLAGLVFVEINKDDERTIAKFLTRFA
jgi:c-di-GMP-binding flagellar brake protein YcgR